MTLEAPWPGPDKRKVWSDIVFEPGRDVLQHLGQTDVADHVALLLLDSLPFVAPTGAGPGSLPRFAVSDSASRVPAPAPMAVAALAVSRESGLIRARWLSDARLQDGEWVAVGEPRMPSGRAWLVPAAGPGARRQELLASLGRRLDGIATAAVGKPVRRQVAGRDWGYLGLRVGISPMTEPAVLKGAMMYGLVLASSVGVTDGLFASYDVVPRTAATVAGETRFLRYERFVVGWSLALDARRLSAGILDEFGVMPRAGTLSLATNNHPELIETPVKVDRQPSLGYQMVLTRRLLWTLVRAWGGQEVGVPGVSSRVEQSAIRSLQGGVDLLVHANTPGQGRGGLRVSYLAFATGEEVTVRDAALSGGESATIALRLGFVGTGLAASF